MGELLIGVPDIANVVEIMACLMERYEMTRRQADEVIRFTVQDTVNKSKEWKVRDGFITLRYHGLSRFSLEDNTGVKKVVNRRKLGYSSSRTHNEPARKGKTVMAPAKGRRAAAPAPEPEPVNGEVDFSTYLSKDLSATMADYAQWFDDNVTDVAALGKADPDRLLALGSSLYPHFQRSQFNIDRRAERRAARTAEAEPEPAAPARGRGRGRAAAPATPPAAAPRGRRGRPAASRQPAEAVY
jgi:hypothetical protein